MVKRWLTVELAATGMCQIIRKLFACSVSRKDGAVSGDLRVQPAGSPEPASRCFIARLCVLLFWIQRANAS